MIPHFTTGFELGYAVCMAELRRLAREVTILAITYRRSVISAGDLVVALRTPADAEGAEA